MSHHARLSPSSAHRWSACGASVSRTLLDDDSGASEASRRGTQAHRVVEALMKGKRAPRQGSKKVDLLGPDDYLAVDSAVGFLRQIDFDEFWIEEKVSLSEALGREDCYGTPDLVGTEGTTVHVVDYKHGRGPVSAKGNTQMLLYALGKMSTLGMSASDCKGMNIRLTILQPFVNGLETPASSWDLPSEELFTEWLPFFEAAAKATEGTAAVAVPGEVQCRWCPAKARCPELAAQSFRGITADARFLGAPKVQVVHEVAKLPEALTADQMSYVLDHVDMITGWLTAVKGEALKRASSGTKIPGHKVVRGRGSRKWSATDDAISELAKRHGCPDFVRVTSLSPAQAQARCKTDKKPELWAALEGQIQTSEGKLTLAPDRDGRKGVLEAKEVFAGLSKESP